MKKNVLISAVLGILVLSVSAADIKFPAPAKKGGMPLNEALSKRQTIRQYQEKALSEAQMGNLLWAAFGVNRANGKFTAPTAGNRQEIRLFLLTADGAFAYCPKTHQAKQITKKDLRSYAGVFKAPCYIVIAADLDKAISKHYAIMDIGYVSQNIYLAAQANGLGTCAMGSIVDRDMLIRELGLGKNIPLLVHPLGFAK